MEENNKNNIFNDIKLIIAVAALAYGLYVIFSM